jgi:hypothetical protein
LELVLEYGTLKLGWNLSSRSESDGAVS